MNKEIKIYVAVEGKFHAKVHCGGGWFGFGQQVISELVNQIFIIVSFSVT